VATFSNFVLDKFIAPGASELVAAEIPDMSTYDAQSTHWVSNFFLNSVLRAAWKPPLNVYAYNYLRRAVAAFCEHAYARDATLAFIQGGQQSPGTYTKALFHWEVFLGQTWHAYKLLQKGLGGIIFEPGSDTVEERLNHLYNQMKHVESRIEAGQMAEEATVPVWLTTSGLQSVDASMTYNETAEILSDIAKWANLLSDPVNAKKHLKNSDA
jgi:hypothetical protein